MANARSEFHDRIRPVEEAFQQYEEIKDTPREQRRREREVAFRSSPEMQALMKEMAQRQWQQWLEKIPLLDGKTRVEAVPTPAGREMVEALLLQSNGPIWIGKPRSTSTGCGKSSGWSPERQPGQPVEAGVPALKGPDSPLSSVHFGPQFVANPRRHTGGVQSRDSVGAVADRYSTHSPSLSQDRRALREASRPS